MQILENLTASFADWTLAEAIFYSVALNVVILFSSLLFGALLLRIAPTRRVAQQAPPISAFEIGMAGITVLINSAVNIIGWWLWQAGYIVVVHRYDWRVVLDIVLLFFIMDILMYILHRVGHWPPLYPWVHKLHHRYEHPRPLSLFVLNPAETISFGAIWLLLLCLYSTTWLGISIYLGINLLFGVIGHVGIEIVPESWAKRGILQYFTTGTFHAHHHQDSKVNYGFYTIIWDKLAGTLASYYLTHFGKIPPIPKK